MTSATPSKSGPSHKLPAGELVGLRVRVGDVVVGRVSDVLYDRTLDHVLGLVVHDRAHRRLFLPWVAAFVQDGHVHVASALSLLSATELAFYVESGATSLAQRLHEAEALLETDHDVEPQGGDAIIVGGSG